MTAYSIYISSTYRDLIEDRGLLRLRLDQAQYTTVCMEKYPPALSVIIREKCQEDVRNADIYVGIIGENYGSIARDENGNELPYSYTEYEFDAAVAAKKKRLIFFKTPKDKITDERLLAFIRKITLVPFFTGSFDDPKDLPGLVLAAIVAETGDFRKKLIPGETKYFCDRFDQSEFFDSTLMKNIQSQIYFFMVCGHKYNGHSMLVKRCIYNIRNLFGNRETLDIMFMANSNPPSDADKIRTDMQKKVLQQIKAKTDIAVPVFSADCFFEMLEKINKNCLAISIIIQSSFLKNHIDVYKEGVRKFYSEFSQQENQLFKDRKIIFFVHVQYSDELANENDIIEHFEKEPLFVERKIRMPTLAKINDSLLCEWMLEYNIEDNQKEIDRRLKEFLEGIERDENKDFYMDDAEEAMERIIDYYNVKKINS